MPYELVLLEAKVIVFRLDGVIVVFGGAGGLRDDEAAAHWHSFVVIPACY